MKLHGIPETAAQLGQHRTLSHDGKRPVPCGTTWAWRAEWDDEGVTVLRCDRCGTTFSGVLPLPRGFA